MVSIQDLNKCVTWSNKRACRKFLKETKDSEVVDSGIRAHAAELLGRVELQTALVHAWHSSKKNEKLAAIEAVLEARRVDQSKTQLKKSCKQIGFNLKTGQALGHELKQNVKQPGARIRKQEAKAFEHVKFCLVCAH